MNIQPFIFNWNRQFAKSCAIEDSLRNIFTQVTVINSDDHNTRDGWINLGDNAYFSDQFRQALALFDGDVLMHVQGDVSYDRWSQLVDDARHYMRYYNAGIYAPHLDFTWHPSDKTDIQSLVSDHDHIKMVACPDETVWFIHKDIIAEMFARKVDFSSNTLGWGWDLVLCGISFLNRRPVIRDYNHMIIHPRGTNYDKQQAKLEWRTLLGSLDDDLKEVITCMRGNREKLADYFT